ncbi:MAG: cupin domain-containing protein [Bacteroidales bacterium]|nr:cupin domain-containing protein [Bacteroidales bacterium]
METVKIEKISSEEIEKRGIKNWGIWEKEISRFDWYYDSTEECLILEGGAIVETDDGNYIIKKGDFVTFQKGLKCVWDIKKKIKKHFNFR